MRSTDPADRISEKVREIGFRCLNCAECCTEIEPGSNLVMVSPEEIRRIMAVTGMPWEEIAEPYPDTITQQDACFSFDWAIRREEEHCRFLSGNRCTIYQDRPWICRTYPFMLVNHEISSSGCRGIGEEITKPEARSLASDLIRRENAEEQEEERILNVFRNTKIPAGLLLQVCLLPCDSS